MAISNCAPELRQKSDNRLYPRLVKSLPVYFHLNKETYTTLTHDIGIGGISFNIHFKDKNLATDLATKKEKITMKIRLLEIECDFKVNAKVVWMYHLKGLPQKTQYGLGLEFIDLNKAEKSIISSYIKHIIQLNHKQSFKNRRKIKQTLARIARVSEDSFSENTLIREELGVDSLMAMEALAAIETIFGIEIDESRAFDILTVGDLMDLIEDYTENSAQN